MKRFGLWVALFVVALVIGCSEGGSSSPKKDAPPSADNAKAMLGDIAKTGRLGSGMMAVEGYIGSLRKSDAAKADALAKDLNELRGLVATPDAMKAKAKALADKL
jgi:hypothetical protein